MVLTLLLLACPDPLPQAPGDLAELLEVCPDAPRAPRQLRLLTRAEYDRTALDLLGLASARAACQGHLDCLVEEESCRFGACEPDACGLVTFRWTGNAATVHLAGSFNGWPGTLAAGGWSLTRHGEDWVGKFVIPDGTHTYKLVLDEASWQTDPANPNTADDGYGGQNSVIAVTCDGADPLHPAADFPAESPPHGYPFDNNAASGLVSATHLERYLAAAQDLAARADLAALAGCVEGCGESFVRAFGQRAFRRPLTEDEVGRYTAALDSQAEFLDGVELVVTAMLVSPAFLYRSEVGSEVSADGEAVVALDGWEVASALSYLFWGTMPDDELFQAASDGTLDTAEGIEAQARRLLADPRGAAGYAGLVTQWVDVERVTTAVRQEDLYPQFDANLARQMVEEASQLAAWVAWDSTGTLRELLTTGTSFVEGPLAALYGVDGGAGPQALPGDRAGLLTRAAVLTATAHSDQTSPVRRGLLVRERLLCQDLGTPPPEAGGVPDVDPNATTRQRFEQHSDDPTCAACHQFIDPVGFGAEHYDAIGAWRDLDAGQSVDASGEVRDMERIGVGTQEPFYGQAELGDLLAGSPAVEACYARQVYRYGLGVLDTPEDACAVDAVTDAFRAADGQLLEALVGVALSPNFRLREAR